MTGAARVDAIIGDVGSAPALRASAEDFGCRESDRRELPGRLLPRDRGVASLRGGFLPRGLGVAGLREASGQGNQASRASAEDFGCRERAATAGLRGRLPAKETVGDAGGMLSRIRYAIGTATGSERMPGGADVVTPSRLTRSRTEAAAGSLAART